MAQPMQYETFGKMLIDHLPYLIAGGLSIIGITVGVLKKLGFVSFDSKEEDEVCKHCSIKNGNNNGEGVVSQVKCDSHESLCDTVKAMRMTQMKMEQQQKVNIAALTNGKDEFRRLHMRLSDLRVGVAVLLDRAGAKVKEFDDVKVK